jgi:ADP-ribosylglycohydrolase
VDARWCRSLNRAERLTGSILGQAVGDAVGFVVEAEPPDVARTYVEEWLRKRRAGQRSSPHLPFGQYTDDTQLARELLCSWREARGWDPDSYAHRVAQLFAQKRDVGAGQGTRSAALRLLAGVHWSQSGTPPPYAGNGSAMRAGQLGLLLPDEAVGRVAQEQSRITHLDPRCGAGAAAIALAVCIAGRAPKIVAEELVEPIATEIQADDESFSHAIRGVAGWVSLQPEAAARRLHERGLDGGHPEWRGISAFVVPSVLWSLYAFLRSPDDYWETICTAVSVGGDTDSMAAMAGAISGARVGRDGLPKDLVARVNDRGEWDAAALTTLAEECAALVDDG